LVVERENAVEN